MTARHLRGATGVPLVRVNTAFPNALYFLHKVWCPSEGMPYPDVGSSSRVQPSAYLSCACGCCLTAAAQMFSHQALCCVPAEETPLISSHRGGCGYCPWPQQPHVLWLFWEDHNSSCSVHLLVWKAGEQEEGLGHSSASKIRWQCGVRQDISSRGRRRVARATSRASRWGSTHQNVGGQAWVPMQL